MSDPTKTFEFVTAVLATLKGLDLENTPLDMALIPAIGERLPLLVWFERENPFKVVFAFPVCPSLRAVMKSVLRRETTVISNIEEIPACHIEPMSNDARPGEFGLAIFSEETQKVVGHMILSNDEFADLLQHLVNRFNRHLEENQNV